MPINIADYVLPVSVLAVAILGLFAKVPLFDSFVKGAEKGLRVVAGIFPYLAAVFILIHLFEASGLQNLLCDFLAPVFNLLGIPEELAPMLLVKPLSGSGSLAVLEDVISTYGADSYVARSAAVLSGCSETVFYVAAVYFGTVKNKRLRYGIPVALACTFLGAVFSCWICRML